MLSNADGAFSTLLLVCCGEGQKATGFLQLWKQVCKQPTVRCSTEPRTSEALMSCSSVRHTFPPSLPRKESRLSSSSHLHTSSRHLGLHSRDHNLAPRAASYGNDRPCSPMQISFRYASRARAGCEAQPWEVGFCRSMQGRPESEAFCKPPL